MSYQLHVLVPRVSWRLPITCVEGHREKLLEETDCWLAGRRVSTAEVRSQCHLPSPARSGAPGRQGEESIRPRSPWSACGQVRGLLNISRAEAFCPEPRAEGNASKCSGGGFSEHGIGTPA